MKIAIVTRNDPTDVSNWSGLPYFITREIRKISEDVTFVNVEEYAWLLRLAKLFEGFVRRCAARDIDLTKTHAYSKRIAKKIQKKIEILNPEVIIGIAASPEMAWIACEAPLLHISDATYASMTDYYKRWSRVPKWLQREGDGLERKVIGKSSFIFLPSQWALESALSDYSADPQKTHLLKFGANVTDLPDVDEEYLRRKFDGSCKILFMGKEWQRKGGAILLSAFEKLKASGMDVELTIVGCNPFLKAAPQGVLVYPNIQKNDPAQFALYNRLFEEASLFVLPTRAEAYGLVFAEAAAFATPAIATLTGGIPSVIEDGRSGMLLPLDAGGEEYAEIITALWHDKEKLREMGRYAREKYMAELNWDTWRKNFAALLGKIA